MSLLSGNLPPAALPSASSSGLAAIASGAQRLSQDAAQIADPTNGAPLSPLVDLNQALFIAEAGAAVVRTSNKMLGTLLDTFA
jgi:hypothetical protein